MSGFLASVDNLEDAITIGRLGADIIDLKDPNQGALGGLSIETIYSIVDHLWEKSIISATVGDLDVLYSTAGSTADTDDYEEIISGVVTIPDGAAATTITIWWPRWSACGSRSSKTASRTEQAALNAASRAGSSSNPAARAATSSALSVPRCVANLARQRQAI